MGSMTIQIRRKGVITLPVELRSRYGLDEGDVLTVEDLGDGTILLVPRVSQFVHLPGHGGEFILGQLLQYSRSGFRVDREQDGSGLLLSIQVIHAGSPSAIRDCC